MGGKNILYIEDNPGNRHLVRKMLKHRGYQMAEAQDGTTGIALVDEINPDLILLDINLPDIDGMKVVKILKSRNRFKQIPIIALTAQYVHYGDGKQFLDAGFDAYIAKPIPRHELFEKIEQLTQSLVTVRK